MSSICNQKGFNCLYRYPQAQIQNMSQLNLIRKASYVIGKQSHQVLLFLSLLNSNTLIIARQGHFDPMIRHDEGILYLRKDTFVSSSRNNASKQTNELDAALKNIYQY